MKDYYEILGIEEEATQEEIRARWAELTKLYHPDIQQSPEGSDRIKEINEAYQVLKEHSTRLEYDLERALKRSILRRGEQRRRERARREKIILVVGLAAILIGTGSFLFFYKSSKAVRGPIRGKVLETAAVPEQKPSGIPDKPDKFEESRKATGPEKPKKPIEGAGILFPEPVKAEASKPARIVEPKKPERKDKPEKPKGLERPVEVARVVPREPVKAAVPEPARIVEPKKTERTDKPERPKDPQRPVEAVVPEPARVAEPKKLEKTDKMERPKEPEKPVETAKVIPSEPSKAIVPELARVVEPEKPKTPPKSAALREEEVRRFFSQYQASYNDKDVEGFLSFFSSRAIQNQKYGMDRIKKIYANFFDQSQELRYQIRNMQVEPNPKGIEVKARYELGQVLKEGGEKKVWRGEIRWILVREEEELKILSLDYQHQK